jgi:hypothetical protein
MRKAGALAFHRWLPPEGSQGRGRRAAHLQLAWLEGADRLGVDAQPLEGAHKHLHMQDTGGASGGQLAARTAPLAANRRQLPPQAAP